MLRHHQRCPFKQHTGCPYLQGPKPFVPRRACARHQQHVRAAVAQEVLQQRLALDGTELQRCVQQCPELSALPAAAVAKGLEVLTNVYSLHDVKTLIAKQPKVLAGDLQEYMKFCQGYGLTDEHIWKLLRYSPEVTHDFSAYSAGNAIIFLKSWGWTDEEITSRILNCYPQILKLSSVELTSVVDRLAVLEYDEETTRRFILEFPQILCQEFYQEMFIILERIQKSRKNKYTMSGSYHI